MVSRGCGRWTQGCGVTEAWRTGSPTTSLGSLHGGSDTELSVSGRRGRGVSAWRRWVEAFQEESAACPCLWCCPKALSSHAIARGGVAILGSHFSCACNVTVTLTQTNQKNNISSVAVVELY